MSYGIFWGAHVLTITLVLMVYYAAIGLWIYVDGLKLPTSGDLKTALGEQGDTGIKRNVPGTAFVDTPEGTFQKVESLKERLREVITETFYEKRDRKALLENLSNVLQEYPELIGTPFQEGLHGFIALECERHGPVGLRGYELKELWTAGSRSGPMFQ